MCWSYGWTMGAQHGLKGFKFKINNDEFNSKSCKESVAASGEFLITNCSYSAETMSIVERYWRTIREMATATLLHCGLA